MTKMILTLTLNFRLSMVYTRLKFYCYLTIWIEFQMELGYEFISIHSLGHAISWPKQTKLQKENNRSFIVGIPLDNDFVIMIQIFLNVHSMRKYYQTEHHNKKCWMKFSYEWMITLFHRRLNILQAIYRYAAANFI